MAEEAKEEQQNIGTKEPDNGDGAENKGKELDPSDKLTPEHPRFKEVYHEAKEAGRKVEELKKSLDEKDSDIQLMRQHNQQLSESISAVNKRVDVSTEEPMPDPNDDPVAYNKWHDDKRSREKKSDDDDRYTQRVNDQIEAQRDIHDDYDTVVKDTMREMETNQSLKTQIYGSSNPARAAYKHGKDKMGASEKTKSEEEAAKKKADEEKAKAEEVERQKAIDQGHVESGGKPPGESKKVKLTDEEKRVAKLMGVTEEKYAEQVKVLRG